MTRRKAISVLIALLLVLLQIPASKGATDEWVVRTVAEDLFYAANKFEGVDMVYLQGKDMQINSWFWFEGPVMQARRYIIEAYLEVMTPGIGATDLEASMTLYGIPSQKGGTPSNAEDPSFINGPFTVNHVNVNLSSFVGPGVWHNITVTNIVREINQGYYFWDGHDVGFSGLSASGGAEERSVATIEAGHPAKLYIHYGEPAYPPGLPPDGSVVEEYRNYTIWRIPGEQIGYPLDPIEYIFSDATGYPYNITYDYIGNEGPPVVIQGSLGGAGLVEYSNARKLIRTSDGTLYAIYTHEAGLNIEIHVKKSENNGTTWIGDTIVSAGLENRNQMWPAMAVDAEDNLHAVWEGQLLPIYTAPQIWYSKYNGVSWSPPLIISNYTGMEAYPDTKPSIAVDSEDNPHVVWFSRHGDTDNQIWYVTHNGTSWSSVLDISNDIPGMDTAEQYYPTIALDSQDNIYVAWYGQATEFGLETQIWIVNYTTSWGTPIHISTYAGMDNENQYVGSIALDSNDFIYVVWHGYATGFLTDYQIWCVNYTTSWGTPVLVSTYAGMNETDQQFASIGIDTSDYLHVMWYGMATGHLDDDKVWYANYTASWADPVVLQPVGKNVNPSIRWARHPDPHLGNDTFLLTDENGTIIPTWNGANFTDIEDLKDFVDTDVIGYPDPEDPDPPGWEDSIFTAHQFKLGLFLVGLIMFLGAPIYGFAERPEAATWIIILFMSLCGVALLWSLQTM